MKNFVCLAILVLLPALSFAQRESYKSSNKYNSAAARVPDAEKEKVMKDKFNGQRTAVPPKPKSTKKPTVQGPVETGNRNKKATTDKDKS